jgi:hypothetical protein
MRGCNARSRFGLSRYRSRRRYCAIDIVPSVQRTLHRDDARGNGRESAMDRNQQQQGQSGNQQHGQSRNQQQGQSGNQQGQQHAQQHGQQSQQGAQQWQQGQQASGAQHLQSMAEVAVRGTALLWDLQMETARNLWRTQARTAAMLGVPDCSELFRVGDDRTRRIFSMGAEQVLNSARQARETVVEMQRQLGRLAEQQTIGITEEVRDQIQQMGRHTEQGLQEIKHMTAAEADHVEDLVHQSTDGDANRTHEYGEQNSGQGNDTPQFFGGNEQSTPGEANTSNGAPNAGAANAANAAGKENAAAEGRPQRDTRRTEERSRARR